MLRAAESPPFSRSIKMNLLSISENFFAISLDESVAPSLTIKTSIFECVCVDMLSRHLGRYASTLYMGTIKETL